MEHPKLQNGARFPESSVPHWESYGWQRADPPAPLPRVRAETPERVRAERPSKSTGAAGVSDTNPVPEEKSAATARPKTPKNALRREED